MSGKSRRALGALAAVIVILGVWLVWSTRGEKSGTSGEADAPAVQPAGAEYEAGQGAAARSPLVLRCIDDYEAGRNYPLDVFSKEFS